MDTLLSWIYEINRWIWQPLFVMLVAVGFFLTYKLRGIQFTKLGYALKLAFGKQEEKGKGDISHFQALMTALAATIGIGNIAGVATAIVMGGWGALFWLWFTSLIGMSMKYTEAVLAIKFRVVDQAGQMSGGPMYYMEKGLKWKKLAITFACFATIATFFTGNIVQSQSIAVVVKNAFFVSPWITGVFLAIATALVLLRGICSIGKVSSYLVPFMALLYVVGSLIVLVLRFELIPDAFMMILRSAFHGQAAVGGFVGATVMMGIQMGVSRGIFSNESGLGTAPIAAAAAKTDSAEKQAFISMTGAFLSTVICTFTGLALAVTGVLGQLDSDGKILNGAALTMAAFGKTIPKGELVVVFGSILFGFSTIIGWAYYGERCVEYLFGANRLFFYRFLYSIVVFLGVFIPLEMVWATADIANAFMALPNLIAITALVGVVVQGTKGYLERVKNGIVDP